MKMCTDCNEEKDDIHFYSYELTKNRGRCKVCLRKRSKLYIDADKNRKRENDKKYYQNNKDIILTNNKIYVENNREHITQYQSNWYFSNRDRLLKEAAEYRSTHKDERNINERDRRKNDPVYRLRTNMSKLINSQMKKLSSSKNGSIMQYLPYSIEELKLHLEKQFEPWMVWNNYGKYNAKTWNDNDLTTWTWQVDHIIPQSDLPYISMTDDNFKTCWALENLRPLSAKINVLNGTRLGKQRRKKKL